jgi:phytoene dehydrogenase-like protein
MNKVVPPRWLKEWSRYASNMTMDNLIEAYVTTPDHVLNRNPCAHGGGWGALDVTPERCGRLRPFVGVHNYRLPAKNYYLCSHAAHSAHGIGRGSSYNCYRAIAKDLGLKYQPVGR